jgi:hypothetical protein
LTDRQEANVYDADDADETASGGRDPRRGLCAVRGCPLLGTLGRAGVWWCFCHFDESGDADVVTQTIREHRAVYLAVLDVRGKFGTRDWPRAYRAMQERLLEADRVDLLPSALDASPYRLGRVIVQQWLDSLERTLLDAVRACLQAIDAKRSPRPAGVVLSSRECIARMRAVLAPPPSRVPGEDDEDHETVKEDRDVPV